MAETSDMDFKAEMLDFKDQMLRFVEIAGHKFDGLSSDVRTNAFTLDRLEAQSARNFGNHDKRFDMVETKLEILREQIRMVDVKVGEVASKVIEIDKRLTVIEAKLSLMETKFTATEDEIRQIRFELDELNETTSIEPDTLGRLSQLEERVLHLEEKISA